MKNILIITGGSRGIGKETVRLFSASGWKIINLSRHACQYEDVVNITVDLSANNWVESVTPSLIKHVSGAEKISMVHNAALNEKDSIYDLSSTALQRVLTVNVLAPIALNQILLPLMLPGSSIIYIGSTLAEKAVKNAASYVISKHAVIGLMRSTCQDLAGSGIHTACICPGFTDTEMLREHLCHDDSLIQAIQDRTAAKRLIAPKEIAELIWFCAQHEVINGSVLHAHLGQIES